MDAVLDRFGFLQRFGAVAEHSPWVADLAWRHAPFADRDAVAAAFAEVITSAPVEAQRALLRAHPELAGKAVRLTAASADEQGGAGLTRLSAADAGAFDDLNQRYRARHGIPFIIAVKGLTATEILAAFRARVDNDPAVELQTALAQVVRIVGFRIAALPTD